MRRLCLVLAVGLGVFGQAARAQTPRLPGIAYADTVLIGADSTVSIRPFVIAGTVEAWLLPERSPVSFQLFGVRGRLRLAGPGVRPGRMVLVAYRALPLDMRREYRLEREAVEMPSPARTPTIRTRPTSASSTVLRSSGSISRGVIAGSNRDVAVESGLKLELNGEVAPGVGIRASLTDADTPIRPDGTTQRLSEFDRVFIELSAAPGRVLLGDFDGRLDGGHFAKLSRKLQGVFVDARLGPQLSVKSAGATSRGQFRSQAIVPVEGVRGPYRLEGASGERFILVLPGSESVFVDGQLLTRGETEDYTIDYATGDLGFTARTVVTSDLRILVEFQYSTNQFTRTLLASQFDAGLLLDRRGMPRLSFGATVIREADSGQFLSEFGLTSADSLLLAASGDGRATRSGAVPVKYDPEARYTHYILQEQGGDSVFVALSARPSEGVIVFRVQFSRVGEGQGSYARDAESINGITYAYRGLGRGAYEPVRRLPSPISRSLIDFRIKVEPVPGVSLAGEWARSSTDLNRLSALDSADDLGNAGRIELNVSPYRFGRLGRIGVQGFVRRSSRNFSSFERYRPVEFAREWNLTDITVDPTGPVAGATHEQEAELSIEWASADSIRIGGSVSSLDLPGVFNGSRFRGNFLIPESRFPEVKWESIRVQSSDWRAGTDGSWRHDLASLRRNRGALTVFGELEYEEREDGSTDSLGLNSIRYLEIRPGLRIAGERAGASATIERRVESLPLAGRLEEAARSWTIRTSADLQRGESFRADMSLAWRTKNFRETFSGQPGIADTEALLVAINAAGRIKRLSLGWLYDARTERTPVLQEIYLRAGPELGAFVWTDANDDDIVQLDELLPETTPNEGNYIRTFLPSDSLASVNAVKARLSVRLRSAAEGEGFLARLSGRTVLEVEERSRTDRRSDVYLLRLDRFRRPGLTTSGRVRIRQDLRLFRTSGGFTLDVSYQEHRSLSELASGIETRKNRTAEAVAGIRVSRLTDISLRVANNQDYKNSDRFESRRFRIDSWRMVPGIVVRRGRSTTIRVSAEIAFKNDASAGRRARLLRIPGSVRYARAGRLDLIARLEFASVSLSGDPVTGLAEFELTDGRGPGNSALWGVTAQWSLSSSLRATVAYDGRAPAGRRTVHAGRVQMTALF